MIKIEKRLFSYCEECEKYEPTCMCVRTRDGNNTTIIQCTKADICINAINQYKNCCENKPIISDPSPCRDCDANTALCCGCDKYYDWRNGKIGAK